MKNGLLVTLSISQWTARKKDSDASAEVAYNHGADSSIGAYHKQLIDKGAIEKVAKIVSQARIFHDKQTLPWDDNGTRLLPAANFQEYTSGISAFRNDFEQAVADFLDDYDLLINQARLKLNGLFKESDYPSRSQIANKFAFGSDFWPLPESGDFRLDLDQTVKDQLASELTDRITTLQEQAASECFKRLHTAVSHLQDRCKALDDHASSGIGKAPKFYESVIGNLSELIDILPRLNINNNPNLDALCQDVRDRLTVYDAEELKNFGNSRQDVIKASDAILSQLAGFYGGAA